MKAFISSIFRQSLSLYTLALIAMIVGRFTGEAGTEWMLGAFALLLFAVVNPLLGIFADNWIKYTVLSAGTLLLLHVSVVATAALISIQTIEDIRENAMVYAAPVLYYPVMVAVTGVVRIVIRLYRGRAGRLDERTGGGCAP